MIAFSFSRRNAKIYLIQLLHSYLSGLISLFIEKRKWTKNGFLFLGCPFSQLYGLLIYEKFHLACGFKGLFYMLPIDEI